MDSQAIKKIGSRNDVWNGLAKKTSSGLTKEDLMLNPRGLVVSKKASEAARRNMYKRLNKVKAIVDDYEKKIINDNQ